MNKITYEIETSNVGNKYLVGYNEKGHVVYTKAIPRSARVAIIQ